MNMQRPTGGVCSAKKARALVPGLGLVFDRRAPGVGDGAVCNAVLVSPEPVDTVQGNDVPADAGTGPAGIIVEEFLPCAHGPVMLEVGGAGLFLGQGYRYLVEPPGVMPVTSKPMRP